MKIVLEITKKAQVSHILGILSESKKHTGKVYNSAYYIQPDGTVSARYDKVNLLSFIESPLISKDLKVPFLSEGMYSNIFKGSSYTPLNTNLGRLGTLICNESLTPYEAKKNVSNGADILINISNDGWLENTHLIDQHFFAARLRAVETGKDMITNSNRGYGGHISGNGKIMVKNISKNASYNICNATLQQKTSIYCKYGDWFIYTGFIFLILAFIKKQKTKRL
jgi:apolipoprotein N-acyltransferase